MTVPIFRKPPRRYPPGGACPECGHNTRPHCAHGKCGFYVCGIDRCGLVFQVEDRGDRWVITKRMPADWP